MNWKKYAGAVSQYPLSSSASHRWIHHAHLHPTRFHLIGQQAVREKLHSKTSSSVQQIDFRKEVEFSLDLQTAIAKRPWRRCLSERNEARISLNEVNSDLIEFPCRQYFHSLLQLSMSESEISVTDIRKE